MIINYIDSFIKLFGIISCINFAFYKIINHKDTNTFMKYLLSIFNIVIAVIGTILNMYFQTLFIYVFIYLIYNFILSIFTNTKFSHSLIIMILSISISYITFSLSTVIVFIPIDIFNITRNNPLNFIVIAIVQYSILYNFFRISRFKNGFPFIKNKIKHDYIDIFILIISSIIILMYFLIGNYKDLRPQYIFLGFIVSFAIALIILQKTFILYQKHKLLEKTLKEYEVEIKEKDNKIEQLLNDENRLIKANHEFYHRQEALKYKLMNLKESNLQSFNEEYGNTIDRINLLSEEYKNTIDNPIILHKLPKTDISEIDDMFNYLQSECNNNNIEFILKINGNIHCLINNIIAKNKLETLIGDLIRNSIIAINYSNSTYRSITAILGIKENLYEFCVYDSGIEFQKETLSKLGLEKATTHKNNGGTGIGYITTFETLQNCKASLIINELEPSNNNYTKSIIVRFDGKNEYVINTYRFAELNTISTDRTNIIINPTVTD